MYATILDCPNDALRLIFKQTPARDQMNLARTCRALHRGIEENPDLDLHIERLRADYLRLRPASNQEAKAFVSTRLNYIHHATSLDLRGLPRQDLLLAAVVPHCSRLRRLSLGAGAPPDSRGFSANNIRCDHQDNRWLAPLINLSQLESLHISAWLPDLDEVLWAHPTLAKLDIADTCCTHLPKQLLESSRLQHVCVSDAALAAAGQNRQATGPVLSARTPRLYEFFAGGHILWLNAPYHAKKGQPLQPTPKLGIFDRFGYAETKIDSHAPVFIHIKRNPCDGGILADSAQPLTFLQLEKGRAQLSTYAISEPGHYTLSLSKMDTRDPWGQGGYESSVDWADVFVDP